MFHTSRLAAPLALCAALVVSALAWVGTDAHAVSTTAHHAAVARVHQAGHVANIPSSRSQWERYDTAAYVVSTLNLLSRRGARSFSVLLRKRFHVSAYVVRSDQSIAGLYFIQLARSPHHIAGAFAYRMGWTKPKALNGFGVKLGGKLASRTVRRSYRKDSTRKLGSFKSTLPSYR